VINSFSIPFHKFHAHVLWRDLKFQIAIEDDSIFNADLFDFVADRPVANRPVTDRFVANRFLVDCSVTDRSLIDRSVADRSVADRSHANRSLVDHFEMPDRSSGDNRYDNISSNISYYIRILEHILFLIFINYYYYYHKGEIRIEALELDCTNSKKDLCDFYSTKFSPTIGEGEADADMKTIERMTRRNDMFTLSTYVLFISIHKCYWFSYETVKYEN